MSMAKVAPPLRSSIQFALNDDDVSLQEVGPEDMLLDYLRLERGLTGTKEGCAEGDCGACTVLSGRREGEGIRYEPVNACIFPLAAADGRHVATIEHMKAGDGGLHAIQRAMASCHGSQCGFCTPGIVMALYGRQLNGGEATTESTATALQGNLCRCTGYGPILAAARQAAGEPRSEDPLMRGMAAMARRLDEKRDGARVRVERDGASVILPADVADLAALRLADPESAIVAGATDVGLWITKELREMKTMVSVGHLQELRRIDGDEEGVTFGAAATYAEALPEIEASFPHLRALWLRIGGVQIRATGTIGGNIANGSPIGDLPPALIALESRLNLRRGEKRRQIALEDFFIAYGRQDREPGDFIESVWVPRPDPRTRLCAYKISKRRDEDIASLSASFALTVANDRIVAARLAYGGMAAIPKRARNAEKTLIGAAWTEDAFETARQALNDDFQPISDHRASAAYRMNVAGSLLHRFRREAEAPKAGRQ